MLAIKILVAALLSTFMMTIFSYLTSYFFSYNFKEPELLNKLISRESRVPFSVNDKSFLGFFLHYLIGCLFVVCFYLIWEYLDVKISLITGSLLGFIAGWIGVAAWKTSFAVHENPVETPLNIFFTQLIIAHIIFGFHIALVFIVWPF